MPRTPHTMPSMPCIDTSLLCWFQKLREKTEELDVISQYKQEIQKLEVVFFRLSCLAYEYTSWGGVGHVVFTICSRGKSIHFLIVLQCFV